MFRWNRKAHKRVGEHGFVQYRGFRGEAFHFATDYGEIALCGYAFGGSVNPKRLSREEIIASIPAQHGHWYFCTQCAMKATGLMREEVKRPTPYVRHSVSALEVVHTMRDPRETLLK